MTADARRPAGGPVVQQDRELRLAEVLERCLADVRRGKAPDRRRVLAEHEDLAAELDAALDALRFVERGVEIEAGADADPAAPEVRELGDFRIVKEIGRGGMGVVYEAEQLSLGRRVAIKVLPFAAVLDSVQLQRFKNEAQAAAHLHHTNIVPVYSVGCERGVHYYAMPYIDGQTVAALVRDLRALRAAGPPGPLSSGAALRAITKGHTTESPAYCRSVAELGIQATFALDYAHQQGVVHRDIKPANLIVDMSGSVWITDFGLASFRAGTSPGLTLTGDLLGTVRYMSPEQALAKRVAVDHRTDIYSLGVTLYELLTLEAAFPGDNPHEVLREIAFKEPRPPSRLNRAVPGELETILLKATAKDPEARYTTAREMAEDLQRFLADKPIHARRPSFLDRGAKWARRHRTLVACGAGSLLLVTAASVTSTILVAGANARAEKRRLEAEQNLDIARDAVDEMLAKVGHEGLRDVPLLEPLRRDLLDGAARFYAGLLDRYGSDPALRHEAGDAWRRLGHVRKLLGEHAQAEEAYEEAVRLLEGLVREAPGSEGYRTSLTNTLLGWGGLCSEAGRLADAERLDRRALGLWDGARPVSRGGREAVAYVHGSLGSVLGNQGDDSGKESETRRALDLFDELLREAPEDRDLRHGKFIALNNLCGLLAHKGLEAPAHREAVELAESLVAAAPHDAEYRSCCGTAHLNLAISSERSGRHAEAVREYRRALQILDGLARDFPSTPRRCAELGAAHGALADSLIETGELEEAERHSGEALRILSALVEHHPGVPDYERELAWANWESCRVLRARGRPDAAEEHARAAVTAYEKLIAQQPTLVQHRLDQGRALDVLGDLLRRRGLPEEAEKAFRAAIEQFAELAKLGPLAPMERHNHAGTLVNYGMLLTDAGRPEEAEELYREAIRDLDDLVASFPDRPSYREYLVIGLDNLARLLGDTGRNEEAATCVAKERTHRAELVRQRPEAFKYRRNLVRCLRSLGKDYAEIGRAAEAEESFRSGIELAEELLRADPSAANKDAASDILDSLGAFLIGNRPAEAEAAFRRGLELREDLLREAPQDPACQSGLGGTLHNHAYALRGLGRPGEAPALYERAIELQRAALAADPAAANARGYLDLHYRNLSEVLLELGDHARAAPAAAALAEMNPGSAEVQREAGSRLLFCAEAAARDERLEGAERARVVRAYAQQARAVLRRAVELAPADSSRWRTLARACLRAEDWQGAIDALDRELATGDEALDWFLIATAHARLGHAEEARRSYDRAVAWMEEHGGDNLVRTQRAEAEALLGVVAPPD